MDLNKQSERKEWERRKAQAEHGGKFEFEFLLAWNPGLEGVLCHFTGAYLMRFEDQAIKF